MHGRRTAETRSAGALILGLLAATCGNGETELDHGSPTAEQEVALGLQAAPELAERYGGLSDAEDLQEFIDGLGGMVAHSVESPGLPYGVDFHVLADSATVDAFSLPGGQVFITRGVVDRLRDDPPAIMALLAHEVGHLTTRHAVSRLSEIRVNGQTGAAVLAGYAPEDDRSRSMDEVAMVIDALLSVRHTEAEEIEADARAVQYLRSARQDTTGTLAQRHRGMVDPNALYRALRRLAGLDTTGITLPAYVARHPVTTPRLNRLSAALNRPLDTATAR